VSEGSDHEEDDQADEHADQRNGTFDEPHAIATEQTARRNAVLASTQLPRG
jgi:hypothetical protein